ncbi:MAG: alpha-amylase [Jaaginema sp. PMC 1079.18]|nr:alpha-amylase [Jaaginema sp. PMC 1080.18]MEC4852704.1 alpha-amylase [Jaaginema sp. PMC 1079.18]MEC4867881.1 alpha-amylase [Jaaginema sp. PMC 1078.18]
MGQINGTMMQYFHWYVPNNGMLWEEVKNNAQSLKDAGLTAIWLPPAYKGMSGINDVGYGVYDLYDLGEFDQRGEIRTKYGTRETYLAAIQRLQDAGLQVYADVVLNHRMGGDRVEQVQATPYLQWDRLNPVGEKREIGTFSHFTFPGRQGKYSDFEWRWWHFDGVDYDHNTQDSSLVYLLEGKQFDDYVALERGNFAYLMGCDVDFQNAEVREEMKRWGKWYLDTTGVDGFRLDAVKHIASWFFPEWLDAMQQHAGKELFTVGEYWFNHTETLHWYINAVGSRMSVLDVPLHYNFHYASQSGGYYDMRYILHNTMMQQQPTHAVTFVENHDSQPLQVLEATVEPWFKPLAYAIILLRQEGYPCIFYADYYGAEYEDWGRDGKRYPIYLPSHRWLIDKFLYARQNYAYGPQYDYFDHWDVIGWTCLGDNEHPQGMAVILSNGPGGSKWMEVGKPNTKFVDLTAHIQEPVYTNEWGWGEFSTLGGSVSVWIQED